RTIIFWASPAAAFHPALATAAGAIGLSSGTFLRLATVALTAALAAAAWRLPRSAMIGATASIAAFGGFEAGYVLDKYADPTMTRPPAGAARDWIDSSVPSGSSVALVPSPHDTPTSWWEAEFWNKEVDQVF